MRNIWIVFIFGLILLFPSTLHAQIKQCDKCGKAISDCQCNQQSSTNTYSVRLNCNAPAAKWFIDGKENAKKDSSIVLKLKEGKHKVVVLADGYEELSQIIKVDAKSKSFEFLVTAITEDKSKNVVYKPEDLYIIGKCYFEYYKSVDKIAADTMSFHWLKESAEQEFAPAQLMLAQKYLEGGYGIRKDTLETQKWLIKAAENGDSKTKKTLADLYKNGSKEYGIEADSAQAVYWYEKAFECGNLSERVRISHDLYWEYNSNYGSWGRNDSESLKWAMKEYEESELDNQGKAAISIADLYKQGGFGLDRDTAEAKKWYETAWKCGDKKVQGEAAFEIAKLYCWNDKYGEAKTWYKKAYDKLELHNVNDYDSHNKFRAASEIAYIYSFGGGDVEKNYREAVNWRRNAFESTNDSYEMARTAVDIGDLYRKGGPYLDTNYILAKEWYEKAYLASVSYSSELAAETIGNMYKKGQLGPNPDYVKAIEWYEKAIDLGTYKLYIADRNAQSIGDLYKEGGFGLKKDEKKAKEWYLKADALKNQKEQVSQKEATDLSSRQCFEKAENFKKEKDYANALKYYKIAAEKGSTDAKIEMGDIYSEKWEAEQYGKKVDKSSSKKWYMLAVNDGSIEARYKICGLFGKNQECLQCYEDLYMEFHQKENMGHTDKWNVYYHTKRLGDFYSNEYGWYRDFVKKDYVKAVDWYKKALALTESDPDCYERIADIYSDKESNKYGIVCDFGTAKKWYLDAIDHSQYGVYRNLLDKIVNLYREGGPGLEKNTEIADKWDSLKAAKNIGYSIDDPFLVGAFFEIIEEYEKAAVWYNKSKIKNPEQCMKIAELYEKSGFGWQPDYSEVVYWYRKAVECGLPSAMVKIAKLYESGGYNLEKDPDEAVRWYRMAVEFDIPGAKEALERLGYTY